MDKIQTVIRVAGGISWIAGMYLLVILAAGIEQGAVSGWGLLAMAAIGIGCLLLSAVASRIERKGEE